MDEDFPRGTAPRRATRSTKSENKCFVQLSVKRGLEDVLFKESEQETPSKGWKKRKTKKTDEGETEEPNLEEEFEGATDTEGFIPKPLTAKVLSEGMLLLAVVQEIHEYEIVLSLPNGLTAFVQITDVSSFFTQQLQELNESNSPEDQDLPNIQDLYQVGNLVPCKIKSLGASKDGHRRIQASLDYKEVNSELSISVIKPGMTLHGCVSSVEDHGYTIDLGIRGTNAFLAKEDSTMGTKGRKVEPMKTGKLVTCLVKAVKANGRSIILTFDPERLKSCKANKTTHTTFSSLIPGTKLDAMVTKILPNSLIMDIFSLYKGCVNPIHLKDTADELTKYEIGQKLVAVVLYNCPTTKSIGLSLNPVHHKTTFDPVSDIIRDLSPGDIIEDALVVRVQEKENLIVQLNPKTRGIVYHSHGSDDKQKRHSPASVGEKVKCRILSFNLFDRLAIVSLRKSILDKPFLGINDVKPGMMVTGVIESVMPRGVAVKIQDRIHGFVPRTHLADIPVQKPQERFTVGSEIELRVLLVEPAKRRVLLTHKKTMVKSSLPILASYEQPKVGLWVHGCVVAVKDFGCIVSFYNDVKGIIPRAELGMDESSSPTDNFYVGQVLKCRILRTHSPESKKLSLSLKKDGRKERESFEAGQRSCTPPRSVSSTHVTTQSSSWVASQNFNDGNIRRPKPPCQNLLSTSSTSRRFNKNDIGNNTCPSAQNTSPPVQSNFVSVNSRYLSGCPSVTVHSMPMVTIPAEEYHQLLEMVKELGRELKEYAREIKELKDWKGNVDQTLYASKNLTKPMSNNVNQYVTEEHARDIAKYAEEIKELKDWKQHVDQALNGAKEITVTMSDRDKQELVKEHAREMEEYKREIKELKDWKQFVVQTLCGPKQIALPLSNMDSQGMDKEEGNQVQEYGASKKPVKKSRRGAKKVAPKKSSMAAQEMVREHGSEIMECDSKIIEHRASEQSQDQLLKCTKKMALQKSNMAAQVMVEEHASEIMDFVEEHGASEQSADQSFSGTKNVAQLKFNLDNQEMVKEHASEVDENRASEQLLQKMICGTEKTTLVEEHASESKEYEREFKELQAFKQAGEQKEEMVSPLPNPDNLNMQYVSLPSEAQAVRVSEGLKKLMLPYVPDYKTIARKLTTALFTNAERARGDLIGRRGVKMDPQRMSAIHDAVFELCPAGESEKAEIWKTCVIAINEQNRYIRKTMKGVCMSDTDIMERLQEITLPSGEKVLRVNDDFKISLLPFVPDHKNVARRLVNGLFMKSERIGFEVRGLRGKQMDPKKMEAVYEAVFELCPVREEEKAKIWKICVHAINDQNRNLKRNQKLKLNNLGSSE